MRFFRKTNIDFLGTRRTWYMVSGVVIVIGMLSILFKGGLDYGLDFTGGTELVVEFQQPPDVGAVRSMMDGAGFPKAEIKTYGEPTKLLIRTAELGEGTTVGNRIREALQKSFASLNPQVLEEQKIGAKVGAELRRGAFMAILFSLIAILIYIGFRFKFIYGVGAVTALFHDVLVTIGIISLVDGLTPYTNFEIDQNMIAAFLTLVGLSVNDTVVVFDRLRENQKIYKSTSLPELMNKSLNETLSRTIITSGTIFLVTIILFLFGGEVNKGFAFALTVGIITGTYSSIYIASAIVLEFNNYKERKKVKPTKA
ncbi:MAG: protein translocase subunit SecF [Chlorobiaceae bacterium]|nr:protein translocase subunit SecF [Chlorobiaceae bacterium]